MSSINALISLASYWKRWTDPSLVVVVLNNGDLNYVTRDQRLLDGMPKFSASQDLPAFPYADYAESLELVGIRIDTPDRNVSALDEAFAADRPVLVEAVVDGNVPPVPPQLTDELREKLDAALAQGDPEAAEVRRRIEAERV